MREANELTSRQRQYAGQVIIRKVERESFRGKLRSRGAQRMRLLWSIPKQDFDLWFCGKVEYRDDL